MSEPKVVLHVMAGDGPNDSMYGVGGWLHKDLEKMTGLKINFVSFSGVYLHGADLARFVEECKDAQLVITDGWTHPTDEANKSWSSQDAYGWMAAAVRAVRRVNPRAMILSELMEGINAVDVHKIATPFANYGDINVLVQAVQRSVVKEGKPDVLVFDDNETHGNAAWQQLADYNVVVVDNYDRAEELILAGGFDYILLDLLVPASRSMQGTKGLQYVGQEMPMTPILAFLALCQDVNVTPKGVAILTDSGHHDHPASAALDRLGKVVTLNDTKVLLTNSHSFVSGGVKQWDELLKRLL